MMHFNPVEKDGVITQRLAYPEDVKFRGQGSFQLDFLLYEAMGLNLQSMTDATLHCRSS